MRSAPRAQVGLALGAWGAVQATAAGIAVALGGVIRDLILALPEAGAFRPEAAYTPVFALELALLAAAFCAIFAGEDANRHDFPRPSPITRSQDRRVRTLCPVTHRRRSCGHRRKAP